VPAAPDVAAPDVPAAPAPDEPELAEPEPLPSEASVRMYDALLAAPVCDADPAAPLLGLPVAPARCRHPVNVTVPAWLLWLGRVSSDPPGRPG
jgi:hypothetical protein